MSTSVISLSVRAPAFCASRMIGSGVRVRFGLHGLHGALACHVEPRVTKGHPASLSNRKGLTGARGDERALLLRQRCEPVHYEGIDISN